MNSPRTTLTINMVIIVPTSNTTPHPSPNSFSVPNKSPQKLYIACTPAQQNIFLVFIKQKANKPPVSMVYNICTEIPFTICANPKTKEDVM